MFCWGPLLEPLGLQHTPRAGNEQERGARTRLGAVRVYETQANQSQEDPVVAVVGAGVELRGCEWDKRCPIY